MSRARTIVILRDREPDPYHFTIDHYALRWKAAGHRVLDHIGLSEVPPADLVIVNIDLTVIPEAYRDLIARIPSRVLNGRISDISRRCFSQLLVSRTDAYPGPVIVKTNTNFGGRPEMGKPGGNKSPVQKLLKRLRRPRRTSATPVSWGDLATLNPLKYPLFESISTVPADVWDNENLIVERYIRKPGEALNHVCYHIFFGDKEITGRLGSPDPIVKFGNAVSDELIPVPEIVRNWRRELDMDFGRLDFVESEGTHYLIDVNKTEGGGKGNFKYPNEMDYLASGLDFFL